MRYITSFTIVLLSTFIFCGKQEDTSISQDYVLPAEITLDFIAERGMEGKVFIVGTTNLPDGVKLGVEVIKGKQCCQDFHIFVLDGKFRSAGFTDRNVPLPPGQYNVQVFAHFNQMWQNPDILKIVGRGGMNLKGKIVKLEDPDIIDSDKIIEVNSLLTFPPLADESKAISFVKDAIFIVDGVRSAMDVEENIELFMTFPSIRPSKGWNAKLESGTKYTVSYSFINGNIGEDLAIWEVDIATKKVRYINKSAKNFSWTPE